MFQISLNKTNRNASWLLWHTLAGAIASLSLPPLFVLPAIFALSFPLIGYLRAKSRLEAMLIFAAAGLGWFLTSTYWVSNSLLVNASLSWVLMPFLALTLSLVLTAFWSFAAAFSWSFGKCQQSRLLWFLTFFSLAEWGRGFVATGFPWNLTGSLFAIDPASMQAASVLGVYGLCVVAMILAAMPAFWIIGHKRFAIISVLLPIVMVIAGVIRLSAAPIPDSSTGMLPLVRLVQPAILQAEKWDITKRQTHLNRLVKLSRQGDLNPELVIWPETAFTGFASRNAELLDKTVRDATANQSALITGIPRFGSDRTLFNSAVMFDHNGSKKGVYDKRHLVPFGEYMPFRKWLPFLTPLVGKVDFVSGQKNELMKLDTVGKIQLLICYEVIFSGDVVEPAMRPDLMVNLTNDAWFGVSAGPWQHLVQAQMRAVEEGVPLFRVANTGITAGFDAYGRSLGSIPLGVAGVLDLTVPKAIAPPPFVYFGDFSFFFLIILLVVTATWLDLSRSLRQ